MRDDAEIDDGPCLSSSICHSCGKTTTAASFYCPTCGSSLAERRPIDLEAPTLFNRFIKRAPLRKLFSTPTEPIEALRVVHKARWFSLSVACFFALWIPLDGLVPFFYAVPPGLCGYFLAQPTTRLAASIGFAAVTAFFSLRLMGAAIGSLAAPSSGTFGSIQISFALLSIAVAGISIAFGTKVVQSALKLLKWSSERPTADSVVYSSPRPRGLKSNNSRFAKRMNWLFGGTTACFLLGIFSPLFTVKKHAQFWIITLIDEHNTVSIVSGLHDMLVHRELLIFLIISLFSLVFPVLKIILCGVIWFKGLPKHLEKTIISWLSILGKWSMLDVLVVGLLVVALKLGTLVEVQIHWGLYFFAASVFLSMVLTSRVNACVHHSLQCYPNHS